MASRTWRVEALNYKAAVREPWWKLGWVSCSDLPCGGHLWLLTGRSLRRGQCWFVTAERVV